jgi:hypothetical protein
MAGEIMDTVDTGQACISAHIEISVSGNLCNSASPTSFHSFAFGFSLNSSQILIFCLPFYITNQDS